MYTPSDVEKYVELPVQQLAPGMYIAHLDRPWLSTPFKVQGFYVRTQRDIAEVAEQCSRVFIDPRRQTRSDFVKEAFNGTPVCQSTSATTLSLHRDFLAAESDYDGATHAVRTVFNRLRGTGLIDLDSMSASIHPLIEHVMHRKEAMVALVRMKKKDGYLYNHSISVAVLAAMIGHQLGMQKEDLEMLTLGCALMDVGKVKLPDDIFTNSAPLTDGQRDAMRKHVQFGLALMNREHKLDSMVEAILRDHHERWDGSGYPNGKFANQIPLGARIAGLVDTYDAMTTQRPYAPTRSSFDTVQELLDQKDIKFPGVLVEQFVQAIGLFPTGSVVLLSTGEVGVVVAQNATRRLKPRIVIVLDPEKRRRDELVTIDLHKYTRSDGTTQVWITQELPAGSYGIDVGSLYL